MLASQIYGDELIEKIEIAFSGNKYPGDENLISSQEHLAECEECRGYYDYFVGKSRKQILEEDSYGKLGGGQSFFKPLAWHYYFPAYLIKCVRLGKFFSFNFNPPDESEFEDEDFAEFWNEFEQPRIDLLSPAQCEVIIDYLQITLEVWKGVEKGYEDDLRPLNFWKENYRKSFKREQSSRK